MHGSRVAVLLPRRAGQVAPHDALEWEHLQPAAFGRAAVLTESEQVVRDDRREHRSGPAVVVVAFAISVAIAIPVRLAMTGLDPTKKPPSPRGHSRRGFSLVVPESRLRPSA